LFDIGENAPPGVSIEVMVRPKFEAAFLHMIGEERLRVSEQRNERRRQGERSERKSLRQPPYGTARAQALNFSMTLSLISKFA
jgi:hypothetical protein